MTVAAAEDTHLCACTGWRCRWGAAGRSWGSSAAWASSPPKRPGTRSSPPCRRSARTEPDPSPRSSADAWRDGNHTMRECRSTAFGFGRHFQQHMKTFSSLIKIFPILSRCQQEQLKLTENKHIWEDFISFRVLSSENPNAPREDASQVITVKSTGSFTFPAESVFCNFLHHFRKAKPGETGRRGETKTIRKEKKWTFSRFFQSDWARGKSPVISTGTWTSLT